MKCFAYDEETGRVCGRRAVTIDAQRGCWVCERHDPMRRHPFVWKGTVAEFFNDAARRMKAGAGGDGDVEAM